MPVIPRLKDKKKPPSHRAKERHKAYNDKTYRDIRAWYIQNHPLCELCEKDGLITAGRELHHIKSVFDTNIGDEEKMRRLRDPENFLYLCSFHHRHMHNTTSKEEEKEYQDRINNFSGYTYSL